MRITQATSKLVTTIEMKATLAEFCEAFGFKEDDTLTFTTNEGGKIVVHLSDIHGVVAERIETKAVEP